MQRFFDFLAYLFSQNFIPHGHCYLWQPGVLWLHVISDAVIAFSYLAIPFFLLYFAHKRHDLAFKKLFVMFGLFILACGFTHFAGIIEVWEPIYRATGVLKAFTGLISFSTVIMLALSMPQALALPSPTLLRQSNEELAKEITERKRVEAELHQIYEELELRVAERNQELLHTNEQLRQEIHLRELQTEQLRYHANLVENISDAVISTDAAFKIKSWNKAAEIIYGWQAEEAWGHTVAELTHVTYLGDTTREQSAQELFTHGIWRGEVAQCNKAGNLLNVLTTVSLLKNSSQQIIGAVAVNRDITERKLIEQRLWEKTVALERSNKELEQFAYLASHDLQAPLRAVTGYVQLLARRYQNKMLDDQAHDLINRSLDAVNRMRTLINDLLAYSRIAHLETPITQVNCEVVLQQVIADMEIVRQRVGGIITYEPLPTIGGYAGPLGQLFQNLMSNGLKFRREDEPPHVHIKAVQQANEWVFSVQDNGIGIETSYYERIFVIFQRLHTREDYTGTGIGLAICKKIVELHQGKIWVESKPGQGSAFYFSIPLQLGGKS